jgi:hypothetical protein
MARSVPELSVDLYQREVREVIKLADAHTPFDEIEDAIDATDLVMDEKAALWMLGWSLLEAGIRQEQPEAELALVGKR